jgi:hypothetical protein
MGMVRVAVVYFSKSTKTISDQAKALAASIEARGAQVDLIDGSKTHDAKLTGHHFLAIGCDVRSLFKGTLPRELKGFLANSGLISGKRSMAWVSSAPLGAQRTLLQLMRAMEGEGMLIRTSEVLAKPEDGTIAGRRLKIDGLTVS